MLKISAPRQCEKVFKVGIKGKDYYVLHVINKFRTPRTCYVLQSQLKVRTEQVLN